jgi:hypothetical protein
VATADVAGVTVRSLVVLVGPDVALSDARRSLGSLAEVLAVDEPWRNDR